MDEQKRPTPERRRLSLTQAALGRPIPKGLELALGMKAWRDNALAEYSMSHFVFVHSAARTPNDVQAGQRQTSFSGRGDAHLRRTVNKFQRPSILQLNIEGLTASKMSVLHHLALQCEALVILLQETHCTSVERLDLPSYHVDPNVHEIGRVDRVTV